MPHDPLAATMQRKQIYTILGEDNIHARLEKCYSAEEASYLIRHYNLRRAVFYLCATCGCEVIYLEWSFHSRSHERNP